MVILTLNCGSSSVKYQVFDWDQKSVLASGIVERVTLGDSVWSSEELLVRMPGANGAPATVQTSLLTLHASRRDLRARVNRWVPSTMAYQTLASWRPWMDMRDIPGVISWRLFGRKAASVDELPPAIVARTRSAHPQLFEG